MSSILRITKVVGGIAASAAFVSLIMGGTAGTASASVHAPDRTANAAAVSTLRARPAPQNRAVTHPQLQFKKAANATIDPAGVISDGTVSLGVNPTGNLIANGVGLLYIPTGGDALIPGCPCEGWGVADPTTGTYGGADDNEGITNLTVDSFVTTATTARSVVTVGSEFKVTHYYAPSEVKGIFKGSVTITNLSSAPAPVLYRRLMDWDVPPTEFNEMVSVITRGASDIVYSDDNGFADFNPLVPSTPILFSGQADDAGPVDQGSLFDMSFGTLAPGSSVKFTMYYGASASKYAALNDLVRLHAEAYSLGYADDQAQQRAIGSPNTFIFGLAGVGGTPLPGAAVTSPTWGNTYAPFVMKSSCGTGTPSLAVTDTNGNPVTSGLTFGIPVIDGATATQSVEGIPEGNFEIHALCNGSEIGYSTVHVGLIGASYVALGDSYASGEGAFSYLPGTNTKSDQCHRATDGYAEQIAEFLGSTLDFAACSGATIPDFTQPNTEGNDELAQLGHLSEQTQLVTLSVGGNDVGFVPLMTDCVYSGLPDPYGSPGCEARDSALLQQALGYLTTGVPSGCYQLPGHNYPTGNADICGPVESLAQLYEQIGALAPSAQIVVVGYPHLFGNFTGPQCHVGTALGVEKFYVSRSDAQWLNSESDTIDQTISNSVSAAAAAGVNISFVDPTTTFAGHGLCDTGTPWLNGLLFKPTAALPPATDKVESFHPNVDGQDALAALLEGGL
jgi:lysophospholipase L1-like esterase